MNIMHRPGAECEARCSCAQLHESEARYRRAELGTNEGLWEWNMMTDEVYFSPRWCAILGFESSELPTQMHACVALIHPDHRPAVCAAVERHEHMSEPFDKQLRMRHKAGHYVWVRSRGHISHDDGIKRMTGSVSDISAQRHAERNLREAHRIAGLGAWEHNLESDTLWWSAQEYRTFGIPLGAKVTHALFLSCIHPEDREAFDRSYAQLLGYDAVEARFRVLRPDREIRHLHVASTLTRDASGRPIRISGTTRDVTEQVRTEEALRRSLAEKDLLLREIHHRVKNNLAIVGSYLYFQAKKLSSASDVAALTELRQRIQAMALVHDQLCGDRDVGRVDFGSYVLQLTDDLCRSDENACKIRFRVEVTPVLLPIELAIPAGQALCELLTNVLKYAYPDGRAGDAWVEITTDDTTVVMRVEDHGAGLPEGVNPQRDTTFGWLLVRSLVEQLDGELEVEGEDGVRVRISFPFVPD